MMWCVELHNRADGPDWTWVGLADSAEEATDKAFANCGGADFFDVGEVDMTEEVSFRVETGELGETLQYRERKK
jgi:hypothetical protein